MTSPFANVHKKINKPRRNETEQIVKPVLAALGRHDYIIASESMPFSSIGAILKNMTGANNGASIRGVVWRQNTGAAMLKGKGGIVRPIRFGLAGQADIIGIRADGKFIAIECKWPGESYEPAALTTSKSGALKAKRLREQKGFAVMVHFLKGVSMVATGPADIDRAIQEQYL